MVQINIGNSNGITYAIKSQIEQEGGQITNKSLSVWQEVMNVVKTANDANKAQGKDPFYTGEGDTSKLGDKSSWGKDFKVKSNQVIELADDVWNKIKNLLAGNKSAPAQQTQQAQPAEQSQQPAAADQPAPQPQAQHKPIYGFVSELFETNNINLNLSTFSANKSQATIVLQPAAQTQEQSASLEINSVTDGLPRDGELYNIANQNIPQQVVKLEINEDGYVTNMLDALTENIQNWGNLKKDETDETRTLVGNKDGEIRSFENTVDGYLQAVSFLNGDIVESEAIVLGTGQTYNDKNALLRSIGDINISKNSVATTSAVSEEKEIQLENGSSLTYSIAENGEPSFNGNLSNIQYDSDFSSLFELPDNVLNNGKKEGSYTYRGLSGKTPSILRKRIDSLKTRVYTQNLIYNDLIEKQKDGVELTQGESRFIKRYQIYLSRFNLELDSSGKLVDKQTSGK